MNLNYFLGAIVSLPLLPILYFQGKKIRKKVPSLPEAKFPEGKVSSEKYDKNLGLITIGESTIAGVGVATHEEGFSGTLAKELSDRFQTNVNWKVYARSGYTAKRVRYKLLPRIQETSADLIVIGLGGNDAFTLNTPWKWKAAVQQIIEELRAKFPSTVIVFCNMPPIKEFPAFTPIIKSVVGNLVEIHGKELKDLVKGYDNVYYNSEVITVKGWVEKFSIEGDVSDFFSDGVHPSQLTYQTWAKEMVNEIERKQII